MVHILRVNFACSSSEPLSQAQVATFIQREVQNLNMEVGCGLQGRSPEVVEHLPGY